MSSWLFSPPLPITVNVYEPGDAESLVSMRKTEENVAVPTGILNVPEAPVGSPVRDNSISGSKSLIAATVTINSADCPCTILSDLGDTDIVKSFSEGLFTIRFIVASFVNPFTGSSPFMVRM